jgi:hypothetical protein
LRELDRLNFLDADTIVCFAFRAMVGVVLMLFVLSIIGAYQRWCGYFNRQDVAIRSHNFETHNAVASKANLGVRELSPVPSEYPAMPTVGHAEGAAILNACVRQSNSPAGIPGSISIVLRTGSIRTRFMSTNR